ncbi:phage protease [Vibrio sp. LaRot3]|uniref:phage protease n=1 Tax=Vibrio sp. LaRot3 TaxID=2998829 RepID=UPI0022CDE4A7|nr:phage protease [Vibrio sp. LaRot3]MDA0148848.1 peptidase [Vibrio sp. LaRot3]
MSRTLELALCRQLPKFEDGWLLLIPAGEFTGDDSRSWNNSNPELVVANSNPDNTPWDIEHSTHIKGPIGEPAPAYGWVVEYQVRNGEVWGRVEFNDDGLSLIEKKSYRFYSPAFHFTSAGVVHSIESVGFTNQPNLPKQLPALNHKDKTAMNLSPELAAALGLEPTASVADAVAAVGQMNTDHQLALNRAQQIDLDKHVPKETYQLALNRAQSAEDKLAELHTQEIESLVDGAIADGKVAPADKEMYLATCRTEEGLTGFKKFLGGAQSKVATEPSHSKDPAKTEQLSEVELATCRKLGMSQEKFLATKNANQKAL